MPTPVYGETSTFLEMLEMRRSCWLGRGWCEVWRWLKSPLYRRFSPFRGWRYRILHHFTSLHKFLHLLLFSGEPEDSSHPQPCIGSKRSNFPYGVPYIEKLWLSCFHRCLAEIFVDVPFIFPAYEKRVTLTLIRIINGDVTRLVASIIVFSPYLSSTSFANSCCVCSAFSFRSSGRLGILTFYSTGGQCNQHDESPPATFRGFTRVRYSLFSHRLPFSSSYRSFISW